MVAPPSGTVTFLFTDVEGSTRLWEEAPAAMRAALARHDEIVRSAIEAQGGYVFATGGDGFAAAFGRAGDALGAAAAAQVSLAAQDWPAGAPIAVRMGLHTGEVEERGGDYFGPAVNRAARVMAAGHGGQVLVTGATAAVAADAGLIDLGEHTFAGLSAPERVYQVGAGSFPTLRSVAAVTTNLPEERTAFVGRERELGAVATLVRSARMVTLTGVGGVGKTRLAVQVAQGMVHEFPGGVWFVELAPLIDAALVPSAVASAIGAPVSPGVEVGDAACRFLADKRALVVLDNCEHVVDRVAAMVDRVLGAARRVRVLATSREPLGVHGETVWRVPSLSVDAPPGGIGDAVSLFAERAAQVQPGFALDDAHRELAAQVCRRLDGIPLAIELAAARAKVMSVEQIATRLDERFRLLTRGGRTAVARQQTLQGAIDWSYELLAPSERDLFDLLGVFAGDFDLSAAAAVSGVDEYEVLDLLEQLADKSMLEADARKDRYRLLETMRQYAWDRLVATGRLSFARAAHAAHFSALAREQGRLMNEPGRQIEALDRLEADYDNLRAALAHLIEERDAEEARRMARRLVGLFNIRYPGEGLGWFEQVIAIADGLAPTARALLLADASFAAMNAGDRDAQVRYAEAAIDLAGDEAPAIAFTQFAQWLLATEDFERALGTARRGVAAADRSKDVSAQVVARGVLVTCLGGLGDEEGVDRESRELWRRAEALGNPTLRAASFMTAGQAAYLVGRNAEALSMFRTALAEADLSGPLVAVDARVWCALLIDDPAEAAQLLREAIPTARRWRAGQPQLYPLIASARYALATGAPTDAAVLVAAFQTHGGNHGGYLGQPVPGRVCRQLRASLDGVLAPDELEEALQRGGRLSPDEALVFALSVVSAV